MLNVNNTNLNIELNVLIANPHKLDVFICGSIDQLGSWSIEKAVKLNYIKDEVNDEIWSIKIQIDKNIENFEYKFVLGKQISNLTSIYSYEGDTRKYIKDSSPTDKYGKFDELKILKGILQPAEMDVQVRVFGNAINNFMDIASNQEYIISMLPYLNGYDVDYYSTIISTDVDGNCITLPYIEQGLFKNEEIHVQFNIRMLNLKNVSLKLDILKKDGSKLGKVILSGVEMILDLQTYNLPITSNKKIVGQILIDVILTHPFNNSKVKLNEPLNQLINGKCNFAGHRGCGKTFNNGIRRTDLLENTIESFNVAAKYNVDMVEFDIMLTKDFIPIVFHDYESCLLIKDEKIVKMKLEVPVHQVTFSELRNLKFGLISEFEDNMEFSFDRDLDFSKQPFPQLENLFNNVALQLAFNIEVKFPQRMQDDTIEHGLKHFFYRNFYLDEILKICMPHVGRRTMVFSSFDADICHMLALKQNSIPILFATSGTKHDYSLYRDPRTRSIVSAVNFAHAMMLYGVSTLSTELLTDSSPVELAHSKKLKVHIWGNDNNNANNIQYFKNIQIDVIILDDVQLIGSN